VYGRSVADITELARRFRDSADDHTNRSPFYSSLNRRIAEHPPALELLRSAPEQQQLPVLLLAAVHSLVLAEPDLELAAWYPTVTPVPRSTDPFPAFARLCDERADELRTIVSTRSTQTNEVGRCALVVPALGQISAEAGPIALIDVGTSAGLNLQLDRFEYRYSPGGHVGGPSPVVLECGVRGDVPIPHRVPELAWRVGIDRSPIDVTDPDQARWLLACVWPDQADRFARLAAAIDLAAAHPVEVRRGDAVDTVGAAVAEAAESGHPVVLDSWVLNYLPEQRQRDYVAELDAAGRSTDVTWIAAEAPALCPGLPYPAHLRELDLTVVLVVRWRDGVRTTSHLATAHPHGYWMHAPT
jgi:hypothetical protein